VSERRQVRNQRLDHLGSLGVAEVEIPDDYYMEYCERAAVRRRADNLDPTLGQLSDD
jgi:hypothetical protein